MANTTEMTRLMRHAADLLHAAIPGPPIAKAIGSLTYTNEKDVAQRSVVQITAAISYAESLLLIVAAAMEDDGRIASTGQVLERGSDGRFRKVVHLHEVPDGDQG